VILTGRTGLVALIFVLPIALSPWPARAFVGLLIALAVLVVADIMLAASPRALRFAREGSTSARLGQPVAGSAVRSVTRGRPAPGLNHARTQATSRQVNNAGS
jgi:uncharacterized protein (DUF58 family)